MGVRTSAAIAAAKIMSAACRLIGKQGVTYAGKLAMRIDPGILKKLSGQVEKKILVVCGTNGKTTTNNLLCAALEGEGNRVVCNRTGSNMLMGVTAAFVLAADLRGRLRADYACIEIDEASAVRVFPHMKPDLMILTNLFRDQLDRYGEIDLTMEKLSDAIKLVPDLEIAVNADDPLCTWLAQESGRKTVTFGISRQVYTEQSSREIREGQFCKCCGTALEYSFYHYSQMGDYRCPKCGFARPPIRYDAAEVSLSDGLAFTVDGRRISVDYRGFYNIYNILAAYAGATEAGEALPHLDGVLKGYDPAFGRNELFSIGGARVLLNLAKNPAGFNQNISSVMTDTSPKDLIIVINDNAQDGTDVSWLWDVDFDRLADESVRSVTVSGIRGRDMQLRLKYVDIPSTLEESVEEAIRKRLADGCGNLYVLVNYTALYHTHQILKEMEKRK